MPEILKSVLNAPPPTLLVISGLLLILMAIVGRVKGVLDLELTTLSRQIAGAIGTVLLAFGIFLSLTPPPPPLPTATPTSVISTNTPTFTATPPTPTATPPRVLPANPPTVTRTPLSPTPIATPARGLGQVVDDLEKYNDAFLRENFQINRNAGNDLTLHFVGIPHVGPGSIQSIAFEYNIRNAAPRDYVGFDRNLPLQDWSQYSQLCIWVESDGSNRDLVIQFGESNNHFARKKFVLSSKGATDDCVPLDIDTSINARAIGYYGVYVAGPQGQGALYIGNVRVLR